MTISVPTPFVEFLTREYLWKLTPPLTRPAELADLLGIHRQTATNWFHGQIPSIDLLILISNKTDISLLKLLAVCGYSLPNHLVDTRDLRLIIHDYLGDQIYSSSDVERILDQAIMALMQ